MKDITPPPPPIPLIVSIICLATLTFVLALGFGDDAFIPYVLRIAYSLYLKRICNSYNSVLISE